MRQNPRSVNDPTTTGACSNDVEGEQIFQICIAKPGNSLGVLRKPYLTFSSKHWLGTYFVRHLGLWEWESRRNSPFSASASTRL